MGVRAPKATRGRTAATVARRAPNQTAAARAIAGGGSGGVGVGARTGSPFRSPVRTAVDTIAGGPNIGLRNRGSGAVQGSTGSPPGPTALRVASRHPDMPRRADAGKLIRGRTSIGRKGRGGPQSRAGRPGR